MLLMRIVWWLLLVVFITSLTIAVATRSSGYTGVAAEGGHYYLTLRSARYETSREQYEETWRRNRTARLAAGTMMISLFAFIGIDKWRKQVVGFRGPR